MSQTGQEHELLESMPLLEWFANSYKKFGATLEIVTDKSQEGSQFVKGFGGIGGESRRNKYNRERDSVLERPLDKSLPVLT